MATAIPLEDMVPAVALAPVDWELERIKARPRTVRSILSQLVFENPSAAVRFSWQDAILQSIQITPHESMLRVTGSFNRIYDELDGIIHYRDGRPRFDFYMTGLMDPQSNTRDPLRQKPMYAIGTARMKDGCLVGTYRPHHSLRQIVVADTDRFARALYVVSSQPVPTDEKGKPKTGCVDIEFAATPAQLRPRHSQDTFYFTRK